MYTVSFEPVGKRVSFAQPLTILEAAQETGADILALCGGWGTCGRCRVQVRSESVSAHSEIERDLLSGEEIASGYRLACRTFIQGDAVVYVPEVSRPRPQRLQLAGWEEGVACSPLVRKLFLDLPPATLQDTRSDVARIAEELSSRHAATMEAVDLKVLPIVGSALREADWRVTLALCGSELIQIEAGDTTHRVHGVAIDVGSTKIAVYLVDLRTGETLAAQGAMNPQIAFGEDIMTRISYVIDHSDGTARLQSLVIEAINQVVRTLCEDSGISTSDILEISVVGNTAMHHFLLGLPTEQLARSPCVAVTSRPVCLKARELGLEAAAGANVYCLPTVAGFVGSDHVAMVLASRLYLKEGTYLGIDIGTNTEISLKMGDEIWAVSCASGPAFEGAAISWGMKAAPGAIERVWIDRKSHRVHFATIGDETPVGICGSGILDCVAAMMGAGILDMRGKILPNSAAVRSGQDGLPEFVLAQGQNGEDITVTQEDVQRIQLAKGAIRSGIEVLLDAAGITSAQIDGVILAGAFGSFIDPLSAIQIGMLPAVDPERITQVGNAAGIGAKEVLVSAPQRQIGEEIATKIQYLELTVYPRYSRFFAHALWFERPGLAA